MFNIWATAAPTRAMTSSAFYRYGLLANPSLKIYKPWLDQALHRRTRRPSRDVRVH